MKTKVVFVTEDEIDSVEEYDFVSSIEAVTFCEGAAVGASFYSGSLTACCEWNEEDWPEELADEIKRKIG